MKPSRRLALRREALAHLSSDELSGVVGAQATRAVCSIADDCPTGHSACSLLCPMSWETEPC